MNIIAQFKQAQQLNQQNHDVALRHDEGNTYPANPMNLIHPIN